MARHGPAAADADADDDDGAVAVPAAIAAAEEAAGHHHRHGGRPNFRKDGQALSAALRQSGLPADACRGAGGMAHHLSALTVEASLAKRTAEQWPAAAAELRALLTVAAAGSRARTADGALRGIVRECVAAWHDVTVGERNAMARAFD